MTKTTHMRREIAEIPDAVARLLDGSKEVLGSRLEGRSGHFMPAALLDSQLATLEPLEDDERGVVVDIATPVPTVLAHALAGITAVEGSHVPSARG